ncbi:Phosphomannomutase/phosphoglucomutase [subsurface metagenome]
MISVSGIRGIYGDGLDERCAEKFAYSFGKRVGGSVVVGRDSRISGPAIAQAVITGLRKAGAQVVDIGLASTPTTEMAVTKTNASGGIIITASHNPREWNGLKMLGSDGVFIDAEEGAEVIKVYESIDTLDGFPLTGSLKTWVKADGHHIDSILALTLIDRSLIENSVFTVCIDTVNGAGGPICGSLLKRLGCIVHSLNIEPTGEFAHTPEPVPAHIGDLCNFVSEKKADVGFAVDPDVDRLSIVSDEGIAVGEEYTLALVADYIMNRSRKPSACNLSTSRMIDDAAARYGLTVHRSPVGEINVVEAMRISGACIGGEGNGGIILPELHYGRDAILGMALVLQMMAEKNASMSELVGTLPRYSMIKEKMPVANKGMWIEPVKAAFEGEEIDERDGIKVIFPKSWIHVRESNTEPVVRIIAETPTEEETRALIIN